MFTLTIKTANAAFADDDGAADLLDFARQFYFEEG